MKKMTSMDGDMQGSSATSLLKRWLPRNFKFYLKQKKMMTNEHELIPLQDLVRPRLRIAIVTETWSSETHHLALSMWQVAQGLQQLGHKILLIRPQQCQGLLNFQPKQECIISTCPRLGECHSQFNHLEYLKVSQALKTFLPDVVHVNSEGVSGLITLHAAKAQRIPVTSGFYSSCQQINRCFDLASSLKPMQHYLTWFHNATDVTYVGQPEAKQSLQILGVHRPIMVIGDEIEQLEQAFYQVLKP